MENLENKTSEEFKKELLLDSVSQLEYAEALLEEDIGNLADIHEEYFIGETSKYPAHYYKRLEIALRTLMKSMEYNAEQMRKSIDAIYENKRQKKEGVN